MAISGVTIWRIRVARWISEATCTHVHAHAHAPGRTHARTHKYEILIVLPRQQWMRLNVTLYVHGLSFFFFKKRSHVLIFSTIWTAWLVPRTFHKFVLQLKSIFLGALEWRKSVNIIKYLRLFFPKWNGSNLKTNCYIHKHTVIIIKYNDKQFNLKRYHNSLYHRTFCRT